MKCHKKLGILENEMCVLLLSPLLCRIVFIVEAVLHIKFGKVMQTASADCFTD